MVAAVVVPGIAAADPPGPTDFETTIVAVEPPVDGVTVSIVAGDAFVLLEVEQGIEVHVPGYQKEPYLEFLASGEVRENRRSPTYYASREKDGAEVPAGVTAESTPEWVTVANDGRYAWHDHRTHWMGGEPRGRPGDVILESSFGFVADGRDVEVRVRTTWLESASPWPWILGAVAGALVGALHVLARRARQAHWRRWADVPTAVAAASALAIAVIAHRSVPAVTGPPAMAWVVPLTALLAAALAAVLAARPATVLYALGARLLAGAELAVWTFTRRDALTAAILPTDAPFWLERAVTAAAGATGSVVAVAALVPLIGWLTRPPRNG